MSKTQEIIHNGLWKQNGALAQILGLCPTLAVTTSMTNSISLGLATTLVMALSGGAVASLRAFIPYEIRIPVFILVIAALVTMVDLAFNAWLHDLYLILGIFIPLIVTNCIVLARVEAFAAKNTVWHSTLDGFMMGIGLTVILAVLGAARELLGQGTILSGIDMIVPGTHAIHLLPEDYSFLPAMLPPGAFILLGCLIAIRNWMDAKAAARAHQAALSVKTAAAQA